MSISAKIDVDENQISTVIGHAHYIPGIMPWWRHDMKMLSILFALYEGNLL